MTKSVLVLNGPNLNLLGTREPEIYGSETLASIEAACQDRGKNLGLSVEFRQSNTEGDLVDWVQEASGTVDALIINAGAYTHTSVAIRDALATYNFPVVELHLSNNDKRETFRQHSYVSTVATGVIYGFGAHGYDLAFGAVAKLVSDKA